MSDDEVTLEMSLPLDSAGFLRRECPTCEREFKWLPSSGDDDEADVAVPDDAGYSCPYCGVQAPAGSWLTQAQADLAQNMVQRQVLGPLLKDFGKDMDRIGRSSGGLISVSMDYDEPEELDPLTEADDMRRVDFACHPGEPLKVLDDWDRPVRCLVCGEPAT
jgi:hypothetical protein